jgi:hypothetical protein
VTLRVGQTQPAPGQLRRQRAMLLAKEGDHIALLGLIFWRKCAKREQPLKHVAHRETMRRSYAWRSRGNISKIIN